MTMTKVSSNQQLPRTEGTFKEFQLFLAAYQLTYERWKDSPHPKRAEYVQEIFAITDEMAENSRLTSPSSLPEEEKARVELFASSDAAREGMSKFYGYFRVTRWQKNGEENAERLNALISKPLMRF